MISSYFSLNAIKLWSVGIGKTIQTGTPLSIETPPKSSGNTDQGLMKKLKGFDGLAMSIGNGHAESAEPGAESRQSQRFVDVLFIYMKFSNSIHISYLSFSQLIRLVHLFVIVDNQVILWWYEQCEYRGFEWWKWRQHFRGEYLVAMHFFSYTLLTICNCFAYSLFV